MTKPSVFEIDVARVSTATVVDWCLKHHQVNRMVLGICMCCGPGRKWGPCRRQQISNAKRFFGDFVVAKLSVSGKPGAIFYQHKHPVLVIDFNEEVARRVVTIGPKLTDWDSNGTPPLPRDLCLYRTGAAYPSLVSVAHENDAWLVSDRPVRIPGVSVSNLSLKDLCIHRGPHFCKDVRGSRFVFLKHIKAKNSFTSRTFR